MTTQEAFVDIVDQDQTAEDMQSDLWSTLSTFSFQIITKLFLILQWRDIFSQWKNSIYLFGSERFKSDFCLSNNQSIHHNYSSQLLVKIILYINNHADLGPRSAWLLVHKV